MASSLRPAFTGFSILWIVLLSCAPAVTREPAPTLGTGGTGGHGGAAPFSGSGGTPPDRTGGSGGKTGSGGTGGIIVVARDAGADAGAGSGAATANRDASDVASVGADAGTDVRPDGGGGTGGSNGVTGGASGSDPLNVAARCTSNAMWTTGNSQNMAPGQTCPDCHPNFMLAGTLFPSGHEPNNCNGVDGLATGAYVVVTDATGRQLILYPNTVGNFYTSIAVTPPYTAKVVLGAKERVMAVTQTVAACNSCHTQAGANGAPGRITLPY